MESLLDRAYALKSPDEAVELYREWASTYDKDLLGKFQYVGPREIANSFERTCADRNAKILDVGCGTGLVGETLAKLGYTHLTGLDLVQAMLDVAATKGVYERLLQGDLLKTTNLETASFDAAISMGTFTHNHVGPHGLDEVIRVIRPRGTALLSINAEIYESGGFQAKIAELEASGTIKLTRKKTADLVLSENVRGFFVELLVL